MKRLASILSVLKWVALVALVVFLVVLWRNAGVEAKLRKEAEVKNAALEKEKTALQQDILARQKKIDGLEFDKKEADKQHDKDTAEIAAFRRKPSTPDTVNSEKPAGMGDVVDCKATPERCTNANLQITGDPQANLDALHKAEADQKQCKADMVHCERTLADTSQQYAELQGQFADEKKKREKAEQQRDNLETALNGGTKWSRTKKELKCAGIIGGGAAAGTFYRNKTVGALAGAVIGDVACHIFVH